MVKPVIRYIGTTQQAGVVEYPGGFRPEDPSWFGILVDVYLGPDEGSRGPNGELGAEQFQLSVCSSTYFEADAALYGTKWLRGYVLMPEWDYDALVRLVQDLCDSTEGADWGEVALKLSRYMEWEFDDYTRR
jgi:hypothetical protein